MEPSEKIATILCDSDFLISLFVDMESTHGAARKIYYQNRDMHFAVLNIVLYEVATVVGRKYGYTEAHKIIEILRGDAFMHIAIAEIEKGIWAEYFTHRKRHVSFFDCANIVAAKKYGFKIASFDAFYPQPLRVTP